MHKKIVWLLTVFLLVAVTFTDAQQPKAYRVGIILQGGPLYQVIDGLREGLKELR